jgi:hypothetical protein
MSASRACIRKESSKVTQTNVTPDFDRIVSEIDITAPPERVFKAIADAEEVRRRAPVLSAYEMDLRIGGRWRLEMRPPEKYQGVDVIVTMEKSLNWIRRACSCSPGRRTSTKIPNTKALCGGS